MDKHELNVKVEQMRKQAGLGDYQTAVKIADKIDWRRVSNVSLLTQVSEIYEKVGKYAEAKDILLLAVERTPMGRGLLFKLTQLALKVNSIDEAEECFEEFQRLAPQDTRQKLLRYLILKAKGAQPQQLMPPLEEYVSEELSDEWMYELAELYHRAGMREACLDLCDRITILFGTGEWVQKALRLKAEGEGEPLNEYQQSILQGEIYYQPTAPRQNAVREPAPLTTPYAQQPMMATEYGTQMPYQTAAEPYGMEPAPALAEQYAAPMTQPQPTAFVQPAEFTQPAAFAQPEVSYDQAPLQQAVPSEERYRNVPTFQTPAAASTGIPSWTEAAKPQEAPAQNDIDAEIDAHLRRLEEEKRNGVRAKAAATPVSTETVQEPLRETAAELRESALPSAEEDARSVEQRYREESARLSRDYVVSSGERSETSEFPGTEQLMVDRLRYEEESEAAKLRAEARAAETEEAIRQREAKLDETKVLPKLPAQERREQLAREEAALRRIEQDKEAEQIKKSVIEAEKKPEIEETAKESPEAVSAAATEEKASQTKPAETVAAAEKQPREEAVVADKQPAETATAEKQSQAEAVAAEKQPAETAAAEKQSQAEAVAAEKQPAETAAAEKQSAEEGELVEESAEARREVPRQPKLLRTPGSFNALIEGRTPEEGLQSAVERLKEAQAVTGFKRPAAKVKAERLNVYGVRNSAEKTAGRDLIIEEAGDLSDVSLSELIQLIAADGGMRTVLLIDNPLQLTRLRASHPEVETVFHTADKREDVKAYFAAEAKFREAEARLREEAVKTALEAKEARRKEEEAKRAEEEARRAEEEARRLAEREAAENARKAAEAAAAAAEAKAAAEREEEARRKEEEARRAEELLNRVAEEIIVREPETLPAARAEAEAQRPAQRAVPRAEDRAKLDAERRRAKENELLTKDAFANYAAAYARNIDCVMTGKSMNALYERIELLQEDGVSLTRKNAEILIEEAADHAERPPLGRRLSGLFSKRYNKDGLLILKEEDFLG
ncbi:hypothetical protein [Stomatobaculum longum]|uniref:hypothetical protein n=1 Tax=Stomatobaculum longum TaxID=796942 RepID=UPI0028D5D837|nr:hypothetical protein [Stomatobaculum longum]